MNTDNTELERRLAWQQAAYAWEEAWRACNDMASHMNLYLDDLDVTPYEQAEWDEKMRWMEDTLKKATLLSKRAEDTTPDPF